MSKNTKLVHGQDHPVMGKLEVMAEILRCTNPSGSVDGFYPSWTEDDGGVSGCYTAHNGSEWDVTFSGSTECRGPEVIYCERSRS